ncbi:MAG: DUF5610 domain-containing protein [Candidatus Hydrogenedentota bacterium]
MVGLSGSIQSSDTILLYQQTFYRRDANGASSGGSILGSDSALFGSHGLGIGDSSNMVLERAYQHLRAVVGDARAELGIPEDAVIDTSAEATANRIADFALGFFEKFKENHSDLSEEDAKQQFVDLIGGAIQQGIQEARGILAALDSLNPGVNTNIDSIWEVIHQRLNNFLANGEQ